MSVQKKESKVSVNTLHRMKGRGEKLVCVTAYDYLMARIAESAGVDLVLVGDSLANVFQGKSLALSATLDEMIYHTQCVSRGLQRAFLVTDMPFLSYQVSVEDAVRNAGRLIQEGGASAVKVEGGKAILPVVERLTEIGIPVVGHIGLTPQSYHAMGGYVIQGRSTNSVRYSADFLREEAQRLDSAGVVALVIEAVPSEVAASISQQVSIPTIGIGAGAGCDGQILVITDLLGIESDLSPKFVKRFGEIGKHVKEALVSYRDEVRQGVFPGKEHSFFED